MRNQVSTASGDAGVVCNGGVVVRERSGKRGKWGLGHRYILIQTSLNQIVMGKCGLLPVTANY